MLFSAGGSSYIIITQCIGYIAMCLAFIGFAMKSRRKILGLKLASDACWVTHLFMLKAMSGAVLNALNVARETVFYNSDKKWAQSRWWQVFFITATAILTAIFWQGPVDLLSAAGMVIDVFALYDKNTIRMRTLLLCSAPCWATYGLLIKSYSAVAANAVNMVILVCALARDIRCSGKKLVKPDAKEPDECAGQSNENI